MNKNSLLNQNYICPMGADGVQAMLGRCAERAENVTVSVVDNYGNSNNPRLDILRKEVEQSVLRPFRSHGWSADIVKEFDRGSYIEIGAAKGTMNVRIAVLYSSGEISNAHYRELSERVDHIFFHGRPYRLDSFTHGVTVPVEPLDNFFPFLVDLSKKVEPARSVPIVSSKTPTVRRLTGENPHDAVMARLRQFTSATLAKKLVARRAEGEGYSLTREVIDSKATGIAYLMRSALDYLRSTSSDKLNRRVVSLYYGTIALAQAEMMALPSGPGDLDKIEGVTKNGHGLYALARPSSGFAEIRVGVLARGFLPVWMDCLGHDTTAKCLVDRQTGYRLLMTATPTSGRLRGMQPSKGSIAATCCLLIGQGKSLLRVWWMQVGRWPKSNRLRTTKGRGFRFGRGWIMRVTITGGARCPYITRHSGAGERCCFPR